jgi:glycosyltransferase involved in cell wall biosynthesis
MLAGLKMMRYLQAFPRATAKRDGTVRVLAWPAFRDRAQNPYTALLYEQVAARGVTVDEFTSGRLYSGRYDIVHVHWPEAPLNVDGALGALGKFVRRFALLDRARRRGAKLVWTAHNLRAHEGRHPRLEGWFWRHFVRRLDGVVSLSHAGLDAVRRRFPALESVPGFVIPHGHYRGAYPNLLGAEEARRHLGIAPGARVIAFFGQVRAYKNVPALIRAFGEVADRDAVLVVAGQVADEALERELREGAARDARVRLYVGHELIPSAEVQRYLRSADLVVLPYREILNSGSALLALSFDRPVLVPARGSLVELREGVGERWVRSYEGELAGAHLEAALRWAVEGEREEAAPLAPYEWGALAEWTVAAYRALLAARG